MFPYFSIIGHIVSIFHMGKCPQDRNVACFVSLLASAFQNTPWKGLSIIKHLFKLNFPVATFEIFPLFQWKILKK